MKATSGQRLYDIRSKNGWPWEGVVPSQGTDKDEKKVYEITSDKKCQPAVKLN
ncbi:Hsp33 chaperonin [Anopheles sinensis]|uniref:Hsp33 chaperonin n=1 Tax=Anopheles sinensis TaxID=74873 RepID=A0A084WTA6_ANOSI|nr:Hsp33 chaperonin [Anopheles sinensis]